jgi:hypothetical protein
MKSATALFEIEMNVRLEKIKSPKVGKSKKR